MAISVVFFSYHIYAILERYMEVGFKDIPIDELCYMGATTVIFFIIWTNCKVGLAILLLLTSIALATSVIKIFTILQKTDLSSEETIAILTMLLLLIFTITLAVRLSYPEDESDDEDGLEEESSSGTG